MNWDKIENITLKSFTYPAMAYIICCMVAIQCIPIGFIVYGALDSPVNWWTIGTGIFFGFFIYMATLLFICIWKRSK